MWFQVCLYSFAYMLTNYSLLLFQNTVNFVILKRARKISMSAHIDQRNCLIYGHSFVRRFGDHLAKTHRSNACSLGVSNYVKDLFIVGKGSLFKCKMQVLVNLMDTP
jgi:hypothetical protein